jgi:hypothetical protein
MGKAANARNEVKTRMPPEGSHVSFRQLRTSRLTLRGNIRDYFEVYLGQTKWSDAARTALQLDGDQKIARAFPVWMQLKR